LTPKQLIWLSEIGYRKFTKIHLRAYRISKIFPGLYPRTPVYKGGAGEEGQGTGREGKWDRKGGEGQEGTEEREGKRGEGRIPYFDPLALF
jgi:hypothetical protein